MNRMRRINFDAYDEVEVDRRGGMGDEVPCPGEPVAVHRAKRVIGLHVPGKDAKG